MSTEHDLRAALAEQAGAAPTAAAINAGLRQRVRRYHQRRRAAAGIGALAVIAVPVLGLRLAQDPVEQTRPAQVASAAATPAPELVKLCSLDPSSAAATATTRAFAEFGYTSGDAEELAQMWKSPCGAPGAAMLAGQKLAYGKKLPIDPSGPYPSDGLAARTLREAGYTVSDAQALAQQWNVADVGEAKVLAGKKLLAGQTLPIQPGSTPTRTP